MTTITQRLVRTYDRIAKGYSEWNKDRDFWREEFETFRGMLRGKHVLDVGCGPGHDALVFTQGGFDCTGIDASEAMLKLARKHAPKAKFLNMDFSQLDFPVRVFDGFWAAASLMHIPKRRLPTVLRGIRAVLKPRGVGFLTLTERTKAFDTGWFSQEKYGFEIKRYFACYTLDEAHRVCEKAGFNVVRLYSKPVREKTWICIFVNVRQPG